MASPCLDCQERTDKCHSTCKRYAEYRERTRKEKPRYSPADEYIIKSIYKTKKKRRCDK